MVFYFHGLGFRNTLETFPITHDLIVINIIINAYIIIITFSLIYHNFHWPKLNHTLKNKGSKRGYSQERHRSNIFDSPKNLSVNRS